MNIIKYDSSRILLGEDLKKGLENLIDFNYLKSGIIFCIVGSINNAILRTSNGDKKKFLMDYLRLFQLKGQFQEREFMSIMPLPIQMVQFMVGTFLKDL